MILLTSESCAPCKLVKAYIEDNKLKDKINYVDIASPAGRNLVQDTGVRSVPVLISPAGNLVGQMPIMKALNELAKED